MRRAARKLVCMLLGVSRWHASTSERHPYRQAIIDHVNRRRPAAVCEIGCGFGDIICAIEAPNRLGGDVSGRVLVGARLCHLAAWATGRVRFTRLRLGEPPPGRFDVVICVNFIHAIAPAALQAQFRDLIDRTLRPGGCLIFDVVANPAYAFNHEADFLLQGTAVRTVAVSGFRYGRSIIFATKEPAAGRTPGR